MPEQVYSPELLNVPRAESPFVEELLARSDLTEERREEVRRFRRDGFLVVDLDDPDVGARADRMRRELAPHYPDDENQRITDAWAFQSDVRELATWPRLLELLGDLYGRAAVPFQTLNFSLGTQQKAHSDVIHFYCAPRRFMCGVWIALEEVDAENGPLFYYPGSHLLPDYQMADIGLPGHPDAYPYYEQFVEQLVAAHGLARRELHVPAGHALIWAANLLHGGSPILDPARSRHSQVTHYFFENGAYYIPLLSDFPGRICVREVIDLRTLEFAQQVHAGGVLELDRLEHVWRYPRPLPAGVAEPGPRA